LRGFPISYASRQFRMFRDPIAIRIVLQCNTVIFVHQILGIFHWRDLYP
jgi:hypothetical protein